jgi:cytosine deaminase
MLEVAFLAAHLLWMTTNRELEMLYNMITINAARAMSVNDHLLKVGNPANVVVLRAPNVLEALREHAVPLYVISHGKLIERAQMKAVSATGEWG